MIKKKTMNKVNTTLLSSIAAHVYCGMTAQQKPAVRNASVNGAIAVCFGMSATLACAQSQQEMLDFMNKQKAEMCSPPAAGMEQVCAQAEQGRQILIRDMQGRSQENSGASPVGRAMARPSTATNLTPPFKSLPAGYGSPAQRAFYAQRCEGKSFEINSGGARGCQESYDVLTGKIKSLYVTPGGSRTPAPTAPLNVGGLSTGGAMGRQAGSPPSGNTHPELAASQCIATKPGTRGTLFNRCGYTIQYGFCVVNSNNAFTCPGIPNSNGHYDKGAGSLAPGGEDSAPALGQLDSQTSLRIISFACRGRSGEVLPFLTNLNPPKGQCR